MTDMTDTRDTADARGTRDEILFLIKPGELMLKGENRPLFMKALRRNLREALEGIPHRLDDKHCRLYLRTAPPFAEEVFLRLGRFIGISGFARPIACGKNMDDIEDAASRIAAECIESGKGTRYKIAARRADKTFPLDSYKTACELGERLRKKFPSLTARMKNPDWTLKVEIRDKVYCYAFAQEGERGLPVGVTGKGILLLSGGIDSPVAGYMMAKRGLKLDAVYFHSYPYTSQAAQEKVQTLCGILARRIGRIQLFVVPFTDIQVKIRRLAPGDQTTLHSRACMMKIASRLAYRGKANSLVTGESLGQVASQTAESLRFTASVTDLPVLRPLIGLGKEEIITLARKIGTYETSILPHEDCCSVFSPRHPLIRPRFPAIREAYQNLAIENDLDAALKNAQIIRFGYKN
jgi:thiamine biosynthesis protein ThiI